MCPADGSREDRQRDAEAVHLPRGHEGAAAGGQATTPAEWMRPVPDSLDCDRKLASRSNVSSDSPIKLSDTGIRAVAFGLAY